MTIRDTVSYVRQRFGERSFWSDVIAGVTAAAILPSPWNYYVSVAVLLKSLVPDSPKAG